MRVNADSEKFKLNGEKNFPYASGKLESMLSTLAERVSEFDDGGEFAREYVQQLKEEGILEED